MSLHASSASSSSSSEEEEPGRSNPVSSIAIAAFVILPAKTMGFEFIDLRPRRLPPIETHRAPEPAEESPATTKTTTSPRPNGEEDKCMTPKQAARPVALPPPPRKPRPAKRKLDPPPDGYFRAPGDLAAVFVPNPSAVKRIRAGGADQTV